uniref:Uncharacterized protein n=1 Tax=viral metagenome TaxID=1070528 RepID=A0A6M3KQA6_9ZZZZ
MTDEITCDICGKLRARLFTQTEIKERNLSWISLNEIRLCFHCYENKVVKRYRYIEYLSDHYLEHYPTNYETIYKQHPNISKSKAECICDYNKLRRAYMKEAYNYRVSMYNGNF